MSTFRGVPPAEQESRSGIGQRILDEHVGPLASDWESLPHNDPAKLKDGQALKISEQLEATNEIYRRVGMREISFEDFVMGGTLPQLRKQLSRSELAELGMTNRQYA